MERILDFVHEHGDHWMTWRRARDKFGYRKTWAAYLRSDRWKREKKKVLPSMCECCYEREATEVHHLSYRYAFLENPVYLQPVCRQCHEAMTAMDNGN